MDGLTLCRRLKQEPPDISVIILSSMISEQMALKCKQVAADAYRSKRDTAQLISRLDRLCLTTPA